MTDTAAKPADTPKGTLTKYVILTSDLNDVWRYHRSIEARTPEAAIKAAIETLGMKEDDGDIRFVAVPARSWRPVTVTVETKTTIRLG